MGKPNMNQFLCALVVIASSCLLQQASATDYCTTKLCSAGVTHTGCGDTGAMSAACPSGTTVVPMTDQVKNVIVTAHNTYRNFIAGGGHAAHSAACRMPTMQWDSELAKLAEANARRCATHDACRKTDAYKYSGQNMAFWTYSGVHDFVAQAKGSVDMWYSEVSDSKQAYINAYPANYSGPAIGHFTVMVADKNTRVGCAAVTGPSGSYKKMSLTCNYATNNIIGYPMYVSCPNAAASKCTSGKNPTYPNLCSTAEVIDVNALKMLA